MVKQKFIKNYMYRNTIAFKNKKTQYKHVKFKLKIKNNTI